MRVAPLEEARRPTGGPGRDIASLSVPGHREVARGTLRSLLSAGIELKEFLKASE